MSDLYRLVYASRNLIQGDDATVAAAVLQILEASQRNNVPCNVTGALLFNKGAFAQVLEGPRRGVEETFERIQRDARHGEVTVLQCGPATERGFGNWSMAFVGHSTRGQAMWNGLAAESGFDLSRLDGDSVFGMLHELVLDEEGVLDSSVTVGTNGPARGAPADEPTMPGFDTAQVRAELAEITPVRANPEPEPVVSGERKMPTSSSEGSAVAVLKAALASERQRTSDLRAELDDVQIALATSQDAIAAAMGERDMWAERARLLARALGEAAEAVLAPKAEPDGKASLRKVAGMPQTMRQVA